MVSYGPSFSYVFRGHVFVPRREEDRPRKSSARVNRLNGRNIERKRERKSDSLRIFTTGPLINTHWVTGCLLCRNWALGALYPPFTIQTYPRNALSGIARNRSLPFRSPLFPSLVLTHTLPADFCKWWPCFRIFLRWVENVSCIRVHWTFEGLYEDLLREYHKRLYVLQISFKFVRTHYQCCVRPARTANCDTGLFDFRMTIKQLKIFSWLNPRSFLIIHMHE